MDIYILTCNNFKCSNFSLLFFCNNDITSLHNHADILVNVFDYLTIQHNDTDTYTRLFHIDKYLDQMDTNRNRFGNGFDLNNDNVIVKRNLFEIGKCWKNLEQVNVFCLLHHRI